MQKPLFDEADKAKIKRYALLAVFIVIFAVIGVTLMINVLASDDETRQKNTKDIIELLEN